MSTELLRYNDGSSDEEEELLEVVRRHELPPTNANRSSVHSDSDDSLGLQLEYHTRPLENSISDEKALSSEKPSKRKKRPTVDFAFKEQNSVEDSNMCDDTDKPHDEDEFLAWRARQINR